MNSIFRATTILIILLSSITTSAGTLEYPRLVAPLFNGSVEQNATIQWQKVNAATLTRISILDSNGVRHRKWPNTSTYCNSTICSYTFSEKIPVGSAGLRIEHYRPSDGYGTPYPHWGGNLTYMPITVNAPVIPKLDYPRLVAPLFNGSAEQNPTIQWYKENNATLTRISILDANGVRHRQWPNTSNYCGNTTCSFTFSEKLPAGTAGLRIEHYRPSDGYGESYPYWGGNITYMPFTIIKAPTLPNDGKPPLLPITDYEIANATLVNDLSGLRNALENANFGDTIYINDDVEITINLNVEEPLILKNGVTLASGRGKYGEGALIRGTYDGLNRQKYNDTPLIRIVISEDNPTARITGLRIQGPSSEKLDFAFSGTSGIMIEKSSNLENNQSNDLYGFKVLIDRNEIFNWPYAGVHVSHGNRNYVSGQLLNKPRETSDGVLIYNNHIHHNRGTDLGYGVVVNGAYAAIYKNKFEDNRHSISGDGKARSGFNANSNLVIGNNQSHSFDMHGCAFIRKKAQNEDGTSTLSQSDPCFNENNLKAGEKIIIQNNSFTGTWWPSIVIRGEPDENTIISNNKFARDEWINSNRRNICQREENNLSIDSCRESYKDITLENNLFNQIISP